jgi:hypothetical protein
VPSVGGDILSTERRFWFDPPFHPGQSVLLHKQADGMWRVDFQLGWDADPVEERKPENITPRVRALLDSIGFAEVQFQIGWASVYTFACQRMERFRHGRVLFAGDSAHGVSPFGARGANSGVQDADNLAWKLAAVLKGDAPDALLDSYASEREFAADENIRHSTRATDFITPKSEVSRLFRDAVLALTRRHAFARTLVNSGRLSVPAVLRDSPLNTVDADAFEGAMVPGAAAADAPTVCADGSTGWLLRECHVPAVHRAGVRRGRSRRAQCRGAEGQRCSAAHRARARHDARRRTRHPALRRATRYRVPACGPTSMCAHAGGNPLPRTSARPSTAHWQEHDKGMSMQALITTPNLEAPDDFYEALIEAHQGLSTEESHAFNARLVLVLANHIGSLPVLREAFEAARGS